MPKFNIRRIEEQFLNPLAAVLTSGTRHALSVCCVPLWRVPLVIHMATCVLSVALQALDIIQSLGISLPVQYFLLSLDYFFTTLSSICEAGVSARSANSI